MSVSARKRVSAVLVAVILPLLVSACSQTSASGVRSMVVPGGSHGYSAREKECLMRAMFFESNRSSRDGLVAVGTVVMNRVRSGKWGDTICGVVAAKRQFAPGVMTRKMNSKALPDVEAAADAVLRGERHPKVKNSMFFHTAGLKFPYKNMHYTVVAGGNAFYEKRNRNGDPVVLPAEKAQPVVMVARADIKPVMARAASGRSTAMMSSRGGDTQVAMARVAPKPAAVAAEQPAAVAMQAAANAAPAAAPQAEPAVVAMAIDGRSPSTRASAAAPFPDAPDAAPTDPVLPAVTEAVPTPERKVADAARADGWTTGAPALTASNSAQPMPESARGTAVSFDVDQDDADAIGAMISGQDRPALGFN
ncbi:cell wall hydrolase [Mesorhizobium sp. LHD-90]|uniref:cell wall hydrolase n=1 Tax=Mesorhizobium sp. LHD-90 TaxID=3071414 RepID=UPI0027E1AD11|nr:cell wall hydrolase [Mesorhizobium sp. LHD-90]MDQ6435715.1 cell wall hydrolase [Mesorhizobium sp. LHD-90]